jgi:lipopolysaccharide transport system permease protein
MLLHMGFSKCFMPQKLQDWDWEITKKTSWTGAPFGELAGYKDLLFQLVRKDFLTSYQQTLLGPFWVVIQPLLTVLTYVLVFAKALQFPTAGVPPFLFYLTGITLWSLFSDIFLGTSATFIQNMHVFGKVYFPRLIIPVSVVLLHGLRFLVQLSLLLIVLLYFYFKGDVALHPANLLLSIPAIVVTAGIGLGAGLLFSIITAKYRDLLNIMQLGIRLLMFVCPIFYSLSFAKPEYKWLLQLNPLSSQFELFRHALLGTGEVSGLYLAYSAGIMLLLVTGGILIFNKSGDKLIDVI